MRLFLFIVLLVYGTGAMGSTPVVPGVISLSKILEKSKAQKSLSEAFSKQQAKFQAEISGLEKELRGKEKALQDKQKTIPEQDFIKERQTFEKRVVEVQGIVDLRRRQLYAAKNISFSKVDAALKVAVGKVAHSKGVNLLLVDTQVYLASPEFDLTEEVIKELNQSFPSVTLEVPKEETLKAEEDKAEQ
jgi:Skp family chaperone for outer membrane proteins